MAGARVLANSTAPIAIHRPFAPLRSICDPCPNGASEGARPLPVNLSKSPGSHATIAGLARATGSARPAQEEAALAKGQKKSNKEIRKPKADKPKAAPAARSFLTPPPAKKGK